MMYRDFTAGIDYSDRELIDGLVGWDYFSGGTFRFDVNLTHGTISNGQINLDATQGNPLGLPLSLSGGSGGANAYGFSMENATATGTYGFGPATGSVRSFDALEMTTPSGSLFQVEYDVAFFPNSSGGPEPDSGYGEGALTLTP